MAVGGGGGGGINKQFSTSQIVLPGGNESKKCGTEGVEGWGGADERGGHWSGGGGKKCSIERLGGGGGRGGINEHSCFSKCQWANVLLSSGELIGCSVMRWVRYFTPGVLLMQLNMLAGGAQWDDVTPVDEDAEHRHQSTVEQPCSTRRGRQHEQPVKGMWQAQIQGGDFRHGRCSSAFPVWDV